MKKTLLIISVLVFGLMSTVHAGEDAAKKSERSKRPKLTAEQQALRKQLIEKYDTDNNRRLNKAERAKMSEEDARKWKSVSAPAKSKAAADAQKSKE